MAKIAFFDLETAEADKLFTYGPEFVRLAGAVADDRPQVGITPDPRELLRFLNRAEVIVGHNIFRFDLMALALWYGADYDALAAKAQDTLIRARLADPPGARGQRPWSTRGYYGLDAVAGRLGVAGKTADLAALAERYGGYDRIPTDDPEYRSYLAGDLECTREVYREQGEPDAYARREMRVAHLQNRMTLSGWRVDEIALKQRVAEEEARKDASLDWLADRYGLPITKQVSKGRGANKITTEEPVLAPLATKAGRAWLAEIYDAFGVHRPPRTATGALALGADDLKTVRDHPQCPAELRTIFDHMAEVTGASAKYAEIAKHLRIAADGTVRVHGGIGEDQASGRWAMTRPSLTNLGKRGAKLAQRGVFLPEDGHVLLAFDLDQVDMRAIAALCQDPAYMKLFGPGMDAHALVADQVFGRHDGQWREMAKKIAHGWNYGRGVAAIAADGVPYEVAQRFDQSMTERFPVLCEWRNEVRERAGAGELLDNGFGRKMRCDPRRAWTQAPALMGQGGARDIMCEGLLRLPPEMLPWLRGVVHDEVVLSVPASDAEEVSRVVQDALTWTWRDVPITCGVSKPGRTWAECYKKD